MKITKEQESINGVLNHKKQILEDMGSSAILKYSARYVDWKRKKHTHYHVKEILYVY